LLDGDRPTDARSGAAVSIVRLISFVCALAATLPARARGDEEPPHPVAFVWFGEPDPTGADQAFLALGRRQGAPAVRETPGRLAEEPLSLKLSRAVSQAQALDFKRALQSFDEVEREAVARGGGSLSEGELVDLYAARAGTFSAVGNDADAWNDLVQAAVLAPGRPLDPARYPPRLIEAARRANQSLPPAVKLVVNAQPGDALVIVDGQLLGRGRVELQRPVGRHFVRVERPGFAPVGRTVDLSQSGAELKIALEPARAPSPDELARRGLLADAKKTLGAYITGREGHASLSLVLVDDHSGAIDGRVALPADDRLTSGGLAAAVDALLGAEGARANPVLRPPVPWYRRPLGWGLVGGGAASAALAIGLGVGLSSKGPGGVATHVDLGPAR
jgi:hypothetical protein